MKHLNIFILTTCIGLFVNTAHADKPEYIKFEGKHLEHGRSIWLDTCENCHAYGIADSPNPLVPEDWRKRLEQDAKVLYTHAIDGFFGPDHSMMPAKGGNDSLTDDEVKAAVDYMTELARYYIKSKKEE
ncbi:MAG: c-type cytochrome [Pseudomonadota bacterium]